VVKLSQYKEAILEALMFDKYRTDIDAYTKERLNIPNLSPGQLEFLRDMTDLSNTKVLICSARGGGKTFASAIVATWSIDILPYYYKKPYEVTVLAGSFKQAEILYSYCKKFFTRTALADKVDGDVMKTRTVLKDGSRIDVLTASEKQVRGPHPDTLLIDEACEVPDDLIKAALPQVSTSYHGRIILTSTPHHYFSYFVDTWENAEKLGYKTYQWKAVSCPWIDKKKIEDAKKELDSETFRIEWEGLPTPLTGTVFDGEDIKKSIIESLPSLTEDPIYMGIDWGFVHPTVITIVQNQDGIFSVLLAEEHKQAKATELRERIKSLYDEYNVDRVFADISHKGENQRLVDDGLNLEEVPFTSEKRIMVSNLKSLFENKKIRIPSRFIELVRQLGKYTYMTTPTGRVTLSKGDDDFVDSLMLATKESRVMPNIFHYATIKRARRGI